MDFIFDGIKKAIELIFSLDRDILDILRVSLLVSISATAIAVLIGVPSGAIIAIKKFPLKRY